jgi:hypothetical protein
MNILLQYSDVDTTEHYASQDSVKIAGIAILIHIDPDQVGIKELG